MSLVYKVYFTLFILLLGSLVIMGLISADMDTITARDFHSRVIDEIECSNFSDSVIRECTSNAIKGKNYNLAIEKITDSNGRIITAEVVLNYKYSIPILNVLTEHKLTGYAR